MEKIGGTVSIRKIAITGRPAVGKSIAIKLLKGLGAYVVQSDEIVHYLYKKDTDTKKLLVETLGPSILVNNEINRKKVADIVFQDHDKLKELESIIHPRVEETIKKSYTQILNSSSYKAFVCEHPLLFETKFNNWFDQTIYIYADEALCKKRFCESGFTEEDYETRLFRFLPCEVGIEKATISINNDGDLNKFKTELLKVLP